MASGGSRAPFDDAKIEGIVQEVLKEVKPTEEEIRAIDAYSEEVMGRLRKAAPKTVEVIAAGSVARGTNIKNSSDIDLFLLFPRSADERTMEEKGLQIAKKVVARQKGETAIIKYAEHPYLKIKKEGTNITVDIVPAFKISNASERITAVDRTQMHNVYMNKHLTARQKDDIRVLKAFLKAHEIYGADVKTEGFSGYLCEILVHHFGSFADLLKSAYNMKLPIVIDPLNKATHNDGSEKTVALVRKFSKEFVVIDPTDENRNVAAVVSDEALGRFILASKHFLEKPSRSFFRKKEPDLSGAPETIARLRKELGLSICVMYSKVPKVAEDILWQQARKTKGKVLYSLKEAGFNAVMSIENVSEGEAVLVFLLERPTMDMAKVEGPSILMPQAVDRFVDAHPKAKWFFMENKKVYAFEEPRYRDVKRLFLEDLPKLKVYADYIRKSHTTVYVDSMPPKVARLVYGAFATKTRM